MRFVHLTFLVTVACGAAAGMEPDGSVLLPVQTRGASVPDAARQAAAASSPAWRAFLSSNGAWSALWNGATGTPHRAFGPAIPLAPVAGTASVRAAADEWVAHNAPVLGADLPNLRCSRVTRAGDVWYVSYVQTHDGVDVLLSEVELRISTRGTLFAFGSVCYPGLEVSTRPAITPWEAAARAAAGLTGAIAHATGRLFVLPVSDGERFTAHLVYEAAVERPDPPARFVAFVDARDGTLLWRHNRVRSTNLRGGVAGDVQLLLPTDPFETRPFRAQEVTVGTAVLVTDSTGFFSTQIDQPASLATELRGPAVDVRRVDAPDARIVLSVVPGDSVTIRWTDGNSHPAERDAFYHTNLIHDWITRLDPAFTSISYSMPCAVNINQTCNAFWDGTGINFFIAGNGCPNTAQMPDVVYHEYGHGINDRLYEQLGSPFGMINGAVHEGLADVASAVITDDPRIGLGFFGPGTYLRSIQNTNRYPGSVSSDPHVTGLILAGAFWDIRTTVSQTAFQRLSHFAKYGLPDDLNDGIAFAEWFIETLVADDDDGDLSNGTPNSPAIIAAFDAHGIGGALFFARSFAHTPVRSTLDTAAVHSVVWALAGIPGVGPDSVRLVYSTDGFAASTTVPAVPLGGTQFTADIPAQRGGTVVKYYMAARDPVGGGSYVFPAGAPAESYRFLVGRRPAPAGVIFAVSGGAPVLHTVDPQTGAATLVGDIGLSVVHGLSIHPETHELLALGGGTTSSVIHRLTPEQGESFEVGRVSIPNLRAFALAGGDTAYAADGGGRLYRILTGTMDTMTVGVAAGVAYTSLALHPVDGSLRAGVAPVRGPKDAIYRVDRESGAATLMGLTGDGRQTWGLAFSPEGTLFGMKGQGTQVNTLVTISPDSARGTVVGPTGTTGLTAIAMRSDTAAITEVPGAPGGVPDLFALTQNYPNPFNPVTRLAVIVARTAAVRVVVYDLLGREVARLADDIMPPGTHRLDFEGSRLSSGVYFARMTAAPVDGGGVVNAVTRMMLLR